MSVERRLVEVTCFGSKTGSFSGELHFNVVQHFLVNRRVQEAFVGVRFHQPENMLTRAYGFDSIESF